ncbi:hypothetical protein AKAW_10175 [Aspergillus luchuensis IFO 4308]|nr:hypothetical protein AKAW_10175 [Aspergillus luchuensis IFO 4308]
MRSRVKEFKVESEEMIEGLPDMNKQELEDLSQKSPAFPDEQKFPVLLVSFVGPQHARLLCASMYTHALIIHVSKLYSFEREQDAPLDLFISWLRSRPRRRGPGEPARRRNDSSKREVERLLEDVELARGNPALSIDKGLVDAMPGRLDQDPAMDVTLLKP